MTPYTRLVPEFGNFDVVVAGGGSAGATAAIAAGRSGARTLLLERLPFLGGTSTAVLDTFYGFYTPGRASRKVVGGIADEVVATLRQLGPVLERSNTFGAGTGVTYHPDELKVAWERLVRAAGVQVLLHAFVQDAVRGPGDRIEELIVATKGGLQRVRGRVVVDATGDADVCAFAGLPAELAGEEAPAQTLTTTFRMTNVDIARRKGLTKDQVHALMGEAAGRLGYRLPRREGSDHITPVANMTATIMTRLASVERRGGRVVNATDPVLLSAAEVDGREQALEYVRFLRDLVPGYEQARLAAFGTHIGVRETRRIHGCYRLTREDVLAARQFDDQIGLCGAPIEDHHEGADTRWHYLPEGQCVGIPYRTLVPQGVHNVLVAGRCFSATHDAHASVRSMAQCMAMGQAAGTAAARAAQSGAACAELDVADLRDRLRATGACL